MRSSAVGHVVRTVETRRGHAVIPLHSKLIAADHWVRWPLACSETFVSCKRVWVFKMFEHFKSEHFQGTGEDLTMSLN